jgi:uncharacterized protein with HEPN domain
MRRDDVYLADILTAARQALLHVQGMTRSEYLKDVKTQDSVIRRLEIIGEAARRVSASTRAELSGLPWDRMVAMRNFLIHDYDDVDLFIVWETLQVDLPPLISVLEKLSFLNPG